MSHVLNTSVSMDRSDSFKRPGNRTDFGVDFIFILQLPLGIMFIFFHAERSPYFEIK